MKFVQDVDKEYENYCENFSKSSKEITDSYNTMHNAFNTYLNAIQEHEWKEGFNYAMRLVLGGGAR